MKNFATKAFVITSLLAGSALPSFADDGNVDQCFKDLETMETNLQEFVESKIPDAIDRMVADRKKIDDVKMHRLSSKFPDLIKKLDEELRANNNILVDAIATIPSRHRSVREKRRECENSEVLAQMRAVNRILRDVNKTLKP